MSDYPIIRERVRAVGMAIPYAGARELRMVVAETSSGGWAKFYNVEHGKQQQRKYFNKVEHFSKIRLASAANPV